MGDLVALGRCGVAGSRCRLIVGVAVVCGWLLLASTGRAGTEPVSRVLNPGAEAGLAHWHASSFSLASYDGDRVLRYPAPRQLPPLLSNWQIGSWLFSGEGSISQVVDLSDLATAIDTGAQVLYVDGLLGGFAGQQGSVRLVAQPLDASGTALGAPLVAGPPSVRDRQDLSALVLCAAYTTAAPVGTRQLLVGLQSIGGRGLADRIVIDTALRVSPAFGPLTRIADGPGCKSLEPAGSNTLPIAGVPALRSLMRVPMARRCGRDWPLRFRLQRAWHSKTHSFEINARGKRIVRKPTQTIKLAAPKGRLRITIRVKLRDGRQRRATRTFVGCR